jgi:hypothetical protein
VLRWGGQDRRREFAGRGSRNKPAALLFCTSAYKLPQICYCCVAPIPSTGRQGENVMAKGQMRSNKEKKKPKADKNLKKGGAAPVNPFASGKTPAGQSPNSNKK